MWNEKFSRDGYLYGKHPNTFLAKYIDALPKHSTVLFLGEGEGRNACYAASKGHRAVALDASDIGLEKAQRLAYEQGVDIWTIHTDLESWHEEGDYSAIMASFLHLKEPLRSEAFRKALNVLRPSGVFVAEFFSKQQLPRTSGGPKDADLLYAVEELRPIFTLDGFIVEMLEDVIDVLDEGLGHQGEAELIRVVVRRDDG
jgi:SAM-dependent methyltransferase